MPDLTLDDDLEGLSAEELEQLIELDNGDAELSPDDQNFSINGIDELNNNEPGDEEVPPADNPEDTTAELDPKPVDPDKPIDRDKEESLDAINDDKPTEVDYQAKYNETMEILAKQKLFDDANPVIKPPVDEVPPADTRSAYEREMDSVSLDAKQQARYDELAEFDEDAANDFMERTKEKQIVAAMLDRQEKVEIENRNAAATVHKSEQQKFTDAINVSTNLSDWQKDADTWDDVQGMHKRLLRNPEYAKASTADKMKTLEKRFASFSGIESDQKPIKPETPPVDNPAAQKKIDDIENKVTPPSSLSSISGGDSDNKPGRIKLDNSSDASDIQILMDAAAASDDPEAIDKLLSSVDFG